MHVPEKLEPVFSTGLSTRSAAVSLPVTGPVNEPVSVAQFVIGCDRPSIDPITLHMAARLFRPSGLFSQGGRWCKPRCNHAQLALQLDL